MLWYSANLFRHGALSSLGLLDQHASISWKTLFVPSACTIVNAKFNWWIAYRWTYARVYFSEFGLSFNGADTNCKLHWWLKTRTEFGPRKTLSTQSNYLTTANASFSSVLQFLCTLVYRPPTMDCGSWRSTRVSFFTSSCFHCVIIAAHNCSDASADIGTTRACLGYVSFTALFKVSRSCM